MNDEQQKSNEQTAAPQDQNQQIGSVPTVTPQQPMSTNPNLPSTTTVSVQPSVPQQFVTGSAMHKKSSKRKLAIIFGVLTTLLMLGGGAAAYFFLYYIPNKPEVVLNNAVIAFVEKTGNYEVSGKLDQAGPNDPDFDFKMTTASSGNASTELFMSTFLQNPHLKTVKNNDKVYVQFSGFEDFKTMAKHYRNAGAPGIQEAIAAFTESSNIATNQQKWIQVDDFILNQPFAPATPTKIQGIPGATLNTVGAVETIKGKQARKYEVTLNQEAFKLLIGQLDKNAGVPVLSGVLGVQEVTANEVKVNVWVDLKSKTIEQITYSGRPLKNATFDIKIAQAKSANIESATGDTLTKQLGYGIVNSVIFNKAWQQGGSDTDKERIADLKGIKTALEIYKARTGSYPERYEMAVNQEALIDGQMKGADPEVFKDPGGRYIGRSGSQYAYVPALSNDDQNCGKFSKPCTKFFINTTLDDGKQYQLNSD
jgi:hypothetical protein